MKKGTMGLVGTHFHESLWQSPPFLFHFKSSRRRSLPLSRFLSTAGRYYNPFLINEKSRLRWLTIFELYKLISNNVNKFIKRGRPYNRMPAASMWIDSCKKSEWITGDMIESGGNWGLSPERNHGAFIPFLEATIIARNIKPIPRPWKDPIVSLKMI